MKEVKKANIYIIITCPLLVLRFEVIFALTIRIAKLKIGLFELFWTTETAFFTLNMSKQPKLTKNRDLLLFFTEISHFPMATHNFRLIRPFESKI